MSPAAFLARADEVAGIYTDVFCAPPWNEPPDKAATFHARLRTDATRPGFTAIGALDPDDRPSGFAYGYTTAGPFPDHGLYRSIRRILGDTAQQLTCTVEVVELAVHPAWLLTNPVIADTLAFYDRLGWPRRGQADNLLLRPDSRERRTNRRCPGRPTITAGAHHVDRVVRAVPAVVRPLAGTPVGPADPASGRRVDLGQAGGLQLGDRLRR
jgi:hypothetical protein